MGKCIAHLYQIMDKGLLRALSLAAALLLAGCMFWQPTRFAANSSELAVWQGLLLMWAVCAGVIHGVGFRPRRLRWRAVFAPLPALLILLSGIVFFFR